MQGVTPGPAAGPDDGLLALAKRPDAGGRAGRPIRLSVNHFKLLTPPAAIFYFQYDVEIERVHSAPRAPGTEGSSVTTPGVSSTPTPAASSSHEPMETDDSQSQFDRDRSRKGHEVRGAAAIPPEQNRRVYAALAAGEAADLLKLTAYDGRKIAFSTRSLESVSGVAHEVQAPNEDGKLDKFKITLSQTTGVNSAAFDGWKSGQVAAFPQDLVAALDIAMRQKRASDTRFLTWGSSIFEYGPAKVGDLGEGCSAWRGYYQSVRPTQSGLTVNIDVSHSAFFDPQPVITFAQKLLTRGGPLPGTLSREQIAQLTTALKTLRVKTSHGHKISYKVFKLGQSPRDATIPMLDDKTGGNVTIEEYFLKKYNIRLQHPTLPCIVATRKNNHIPMELCAIPDGTRRNRLLSPHQTASMIRVAAMKPHSRLEYACKSAEKADFSGDPICREFGLGVKNSKLEVQGRVLQPPEIVFGQDKKVKPMHGAWRIPQRVKYYRPSAQHSPLYNWAVIKYDRSLRLDETHRFVDALCRMMSDRGMIIGKNDPRIFELDRATASNVPRDMKRVVGTMNDQLGHQQKCQLLLIMVRNQDTPVYNAIKKTGDCEIGIPTQVMLTKHASAQKARGVGAYTDNICLKINIKLGGMNFSPTKAISGPTLPFEDKPYMVVGADVTHPPPGSKAFPSIAAMVGSMDRWLCNHYGAYRSQEPGVEKSDGVMQDMLRDILLRFAYVNKRLPAVVLMFRDGVSEGQFSDVMSREVEAMRRAFKDVSETDRNFTNYRPKIVYIVVQKRHHTRFSTQVLQEADRSGNVPAGTVIDTDVCHPKDFDYYLFSHAGLQGTSVPAHYHVLFDELALGSDALQSFSFRLCHAFGRASRSVSLPAPTYYSHLLAYRARCFVPDPTPASVSSGASTGALTDLARVHDNMKSSMHYI